MRLSLIVALSPEGVIGRGGALPWRLPADLQRFRRLTWGKPILMGRKTLESIGRPLPGRCNIVLTRQASPVVEGVRVAHSCEEAIALARDDLLRSGAEEAFVIGGAQVYAAFLDRCDRAYVTIVEGTFAGDTTFPGGVPGPPAWHVRQEEYHPADEKNPYPHHFLVLDRVKTGNEESSGRI